MKLCFLNNGDSNNPQLWSGTPYRLKQEFLGYPEEIELSEVDFSLPRLYKSLCFRLFDKWHEFTLGTSREPWYSPFAKRRLAKRVEAIAPDADFYFFGSDGIYPPAWTVKNKKYVLYGDSVASAYFPYLKGNAFWRKAYERHHNREDAVLVNHATIIFTQNAWSRDYLIQEYGFPESRVYNVGFGVNLKPYEAEKNYDEEEMLIVLRHGTEHYKGLDLLLEAFKILRQLRPMAKLNVVGTTGEAVDGVTYWDGYPREKTVELFQRAALYVMPALREPNGITYLEGLANRAPIVGLDRFAVPEFSGYGKWGFLCEHEDPQELSAVLEEAISDKQRLAEMGTLGQQFVAERYDWTKVVRKMIDIMEAHK